MDAVDLVICGAGGHTGRRALCLFPLLRHTLASEAIHVSLHGVVDAVSETHERILSLLEALRLEIQAKKPFSHLVKCLEERTATGPPLLVYDASPTPVHLEHLVLARTHGVHYLGEKPLVTNSHELGLLRTELSPPFSNRVFVDFIETHSAPVEIMTARLRERGVIPHRFVFCREGSGGLKKLLSPHARKGIAGGAILDKSVHDFSILHALLKSSGRAVPDSKALSVAVREALLMPADIEAVLWNEARFLATDNRTLSKPRESVRNTLHEAADAAACVALEGDTWKAEIHTSWLGTRKAEDLLAHVNRTPRDHIGLEPLNLFGSDLEIPISDSRIAVIEGEGGPWLLDFLYKNKGGTGSQVFELGGSPSSLTENSKDPVWLAFPENPLGRVLSTACRSVAGRPDVAHERYIDEAAALWVHELVMTARQKVVEDTENPQLQMENARRAVRVALGLYIETVRENSTTKAVIFDMDNTLFDTKRAVPSVESLSSAYTQHFEIAWEDLEPRVWTRSPSALIAELINEGRLKAGTSEVLVAQAIFSAYADLPVQKPELVRGYDECKAQCAELGLNLALVTTGVWILQARKIQMAGLERDFGTIIIDDARCELGKKMSFEALARKWGLPARRVAVVGDDVKSELKAAEELGMKRVHVGGPPKCPCGAHEHTADFLALERILASWGAAPPAGADCAVVTAPQEPGAPGSVPPDPIV